MTETAVPPLLLQEGSGELAAALGAGLRSRGHRVIGNASEAEETCVLVLAFDPRDAREWSGRIVAAYQRAEKDRVARVVLVSSLEVAGPHRPDEGPRFEGCEERPATPEARAMLAGEEEALEGRNRSGLPLVILRAGTLWGPGRPAFWPELWSVRGREGRERFTRRWADRLHAGLLLEDLVAMVSAAATRGDWIYHLVRDEEGTLGAQRRKLERAAAALDMPLRPLAAPSERAVPDPDAVHWNYPPHRAARELGFLAEPQPSDAALRALLQDPATRPDPLSLVETGRAGPLLETIARAELGTEPERILRRPLEEFLARSAREAEARAVLDLGGGAGFASRTLARRLGLPGRARFPSEAEREEALALARKDGVAEVVDYAVGDPLECLRDLRPGELIASTGDLHRLGSLGVADRIAEQLAPGDRFLAIEPHRGDSFHPLLEGPLRALWRRGRLGEEFLAAHPEFRERLAERPIRGERPSPTAWERAAAERFTVLTRQGAHGFLAPWAGRFARGEAPLPVPGRLAARLDRLLLRFPPVADHGMILCLALTHRAAEPEPDWLNWDPNRDGRRR